MPLQQESNTVDNDEIGVDFCISNFKEISIEYISWTDSHFRIRSTCTITQATAHPFCMRLFRTWKHQNINANVAFRQWHSLSENRKICNIIEYSLNAIDNTKMIWNRNIMGSVFADQWTGIEFYRSQKNDLFALQFMNVPIDTRFCCGIVEHRLGKLISQLKVFCFFF